MKIAMNIFLRKCVLRGISPLTVKVLQYKPEVIEAMEEVKRISKDSNVKSYTDLKERFKELDS